MDSQEQYERRRLGRHRAVTSLKRLGHHSYEIQRRDLRPLAIVTTNSYEFTADEPYNLLESYEGIDPEIILVTNPNCQGLSTDSQLAAEQTGVSLVLLQRSTQRLGQGMDLRSRWPQLQALADAAEDLTGLQVWVFGSALRRDDPGDLESPRSCPTVHQKNHQL